MSGSRLVEQHYTGFAGICRAVATGLKDPADLAVDAAHNALFVAAVNRSQPYSDKQDGIYLLRLNNAAAPAVKLAVLRRIFIPTASRFSAAMTAPKL